MKFKLIFALFNGIIIISFLFVFLMPLFVLGFEYTAGFWTQNWYLVCIFVVILLSLDLYFFLNWKTFSLLEKEDWPALSVYLEQIIFGKKRFADQPIRLLCNAWVVQGKPLEILRLEALLREARPSLVARHALLLGIPHLLQNESADMEAFFRPLATLEKIPDTQWIRFNLAFSLLSNKKTEEAVVILEKLAVQKKERIVQLLSLYLLDSQTTPESGQLIIRETAQKEFRASFTSGTLPAHIDKFRENLQVIILSKFIDEASKWIFASHPALTPQTTEHTNE